MHSTESHILIPLVHLAPTSTEVDDEDVLKILAQIYMIQRLYQHYLYSIHSYWFCSDFPHPREIEFNVLLIQVLHKCFLGDRFYGHCLFVKHEGGLGPSWFVYYIRYSSCKCFQFNPFKSFVFVIPCVCHSERCADTMNTKDRIGKKEEPFWWTVNENGSTFYPFRLQSDPTGNWWRHKSYFAILRIQCSLG